MAKPRVFVSSTCHDLKYIRDNLKEFIESLGYEPILSDKGDIPYRPDIPLDESCYRDVKNSDIYVLLIGGRYGSEISRTNTGEEKTFYDQYESITETEYKEAVRSEIPIYVLIETAVSSEYDTFLKNRDNKVNYAHADSINIFYLIEKIRDQPRNNPIVIMTRSSRTRPPIF